MEKILIKNITEGFAYSAHKLIIKLRVREVGAGWSLEVQSGTKGGTLKLSATTFATQAEASAALESRVAEALAAGYAA